MNKAAMNGLIVLGACVVYIMLGLMSGRTSMNEGLGPDGPIYAAMVTQHDLQRASAVNKLAPAFPLAAAMLYAATGDVARSFTIVNMLAFAVLVFAACLIFDAPSAPVIVKVAVAMTLALLGMPVRHSAFDPGQPHLLGVALIALAVAACEWRHSALTSLLHAAAAFASPVGLVAPLYGIARTWRLGQRTAAALAVFAPALLLWLLVQYWARGGIAGLVDLMRVTRVRSDTAFWSEAPFILFGAYCLVTGLGGFTMLLWSRPKWIKEAMLEQRELLALVVPVVPFILTSGLEVPRTIAFLLPFWFLVLGAWVRRAGMRLMVPMGLAVLLTILTQHPWVRLNDVNYFVDWFPYSVYAERVNVTVGDFSNIWRLRIFMAVGGVAVCAVWARTLARRGATAAAVR